MVRIEPIHREHLSRYDERFGLIEAFMGFVPHVDADDGERALDLRGVPHR